MKLLAIATLFFSIQVSAQVRQFQTARLISTAGAGVASISLLDSAFLNPASLGFFRKSEVSILHNKVSYEANGQDQDFTNWGGVIADTKSAFRGTVKYIDSENQGYKDTTMGITFAKMRSRNTSFGAGYDYKKVTDKSTGEKDKNHILTLGMTSVISKNLTFGATLIDPFNASSFDHRVILGFQTQLVSSVYFMLDAMTNQRLKDFSDTLGWRGAIQFKIMKNAFIRAGYSEDKLRNIKETGYGLEIRLAKFHINAAIKQAKIKDENLPSILSAATTEKHFMLSLAARF